MTEIIHKSLLRDMVLAAEHGDIARVAELLGLCVKPDEIDDASRVTGLFAAASVGHVEVVRLLLPHVTHPDRQDVYGTTPLAYVVHELGEKPTDEKRARLMTVLRLLLEAGADPRGGSARDQAPLSHSREYGLKEIETLFSGYL